MLIYLVDNTIDGQGASPRELRAVSGRIRPEVEILTEPFRRGFAGTGPGISVLPTLS